jgi:hypothetical protein
VLAVMLRKRIVHSSNLQAPQVILTLKYLPIIAGPIYLGVLDLPCQ